MCNTANINELKIEELEQVTGGEFDLKMLYTLNNFMKAVSAKYEAWTEDKSSLTKQEKYNAAMTIIQEVYDNLSTEEKACIDQFKQEFPMVWDNFINSLANGL